MNSTTTISNIDQSVSNQLMYLHHRLTRLKDFLDYS